MIKIPENAENLSLSLETLDGEIYTDKDTTQQPFGETESVVAFWEDDVIRMIPMHQIKWVKMDFNE